MIENFLKKKKYELKCLLLFLKIKENARGVGK